MLKYMTLIVLTLLIYGFVNMIIVVRLNVIYSTPESRSLILGFKNRGFWDAKGDLIPAETDFLS